MNSTSNRVKTAYCVLIAFVSTITFSPLVAHIPYHIVWLPLLTGNIAATLLGIYNLAKDIKDGKKDGALIHRNLSLLPYYIIEGVFGGFVGALATRFI